MYYLIQSSKVPVGILFMYLSYLCVTSRHTHIALTMLFRNIVRSIKINVYIQSTNYAILRQNEVTSIRLYQRGYINAFNADFSRNIPSSGGLFPNAKSLKPRQLTVYRPLRRTIICVDY